ncbi:hypothetical protein ASG54_07245 [Aureimonas sp. Leaf460]|nr:hypothetical protein ASG54_07245 [Aureimonas sp. Leaf460]
MGIALFCLVLLAAIFAGYWDMLNTEKLRVASETPSEPSASAGASAEPKAEPGPAETAPATATGETAATTAAADLGPPVPTFDILRVEPDGSTVMAGKAAAGSTVRLTDGTSVLGEDKVGPGGDFAIVLDKPLPVGEHQIRIEATGADGAAATSRETAIVSVPEPGREDELLALVQTPDQPSRLISVPKASESTGRTALAAGSGTTEAAADGVTPPVSDPSPASNLVGDGALAVEAVEIEDDTVYVAGRAPAGLTIRVYIDNVFLAEHAGRRTDRFLVSTRSAVAPGQHMVRADQVAADGRVLARVEVPFVKPEGRSMSAVAGAGSNAAPTGDAAPAPGAAPGSGEPSSQTLAADGAMPPAGNVPAGDASSATAEPGAVSTGAPGRETAVSTADATETAGDGDVASARQAPLQAAGARVIIRRGDTLWRISRQAYGQGARYTTIYLANGDQIRDPNRIYPGQVFRMPEGAAQ